MPNDTDPNLQPAATQLRWRPPSSTREFARVPGGQGLAAVAEVAAAEVGTVEVGTADVMPVAAGAAPAENHPAYARTLDVGNRESSAEFEDGDILESGTMVGKRYVVERHVSSGSFGAVYKASDRLIDNHAVALKLLHTRAGSDQADDAALRELRLIASVAHPSVVQFKDYGWLDGRLWFAMPWYEGETLQARLTDPEGERLAVSRAQARPIFERLAHGLAAMHSVGVHHHDIKPENIFLSRVAGFAEGMPVLLDLGIAAERGELPAGFTAEYTAPETAARALGEDRGPIGEAADVFALALTLRSALDPTSAPDTGGYSVALLNRRASVPMEAPSGRALRYLAPHFKRWLALDPLERPTAAQFALELAVLTAPEERRLARARFLRRVVPLALAAGIALFALTVKLFRQSEVLLEQRERLSEQMQQTQALEVRSAQTLAELEDQVEAVGQKDRQLSQAIDVARKLDRKLAQSTRQREHLTRNLRANEQERMALSSALTEVQNEQQRLEHERNTVRAHRDSLSRERDALLLERDSLRAFANDLRNDRELDAQRLRETEVRLTALEGQLGNARQALRDAEGAREAMRIERDKLTQDRRGLERELERVQRRRRGSAVDERTLSASPADAPPDVPAPATGAATVMQPVFDAPR